MGDEHIEEPLLTENPNRFVLFPIQHDRVWEMYKKEMACFWTVAEVDLGEDIKDWSRKLTDNERRFIVHVLGALLEKVQTKYCFIHFSQHSSRRPTALFWKIWR